MAPSLPFRGTHASPDVSRSTMRPGDFTVGWICALHEELAASRAMLDAEYSSLGPQDPNDQNMYTAGRIGEHNVIMVCLPTGKYGIESAATTARDLQRSFGSIKIGLMVGTGGGVPTEQNDIRLGDVVVSKPVKEHGGVIHYDITKIKPNGAFDRKGHLDKPPRQLLTAVQNLQATHELYEPEFHNHLEAMLQSFPKMKLDYGRPDPEPLSLQSEDRTFDRALRTDPLRPRVHYGLIASGNKVIASAMERDRLRSEAEILCFETEAAGLMDTFPCLVIRGICNYADAHKHDGWHKYAAAAAAAYAKELLLSIPAARPTIELATASRKVPMDSKYRMGFRFYDVEPVDKFVPREEAMAELDDYLLSDDQRRKIFVIQGMGGMGKTQLSLNYFRSHKDDYTASIWINGTSQTTVKKSFRDFAMRLSREHGVLKEVQSLTDDEIEQAVLDWLAEVDNQHWLLVFDNVDLDPDSAAPDQQAYDVQQYIPKADHGSLIITTRLQSLDDLGRSMPLQLFNLDQSQHLLEIKVERSLSDDKEAKKTN